MCAMAFQITGISIVCSTVCSGAVQRKRPSSASLAFVRGIHRWPLDSHHKGQCFHLTTSSLTRHITRVSPLPGPWRQCRIKNRRLWHSTYIVLDVNIYCTRCRVLFWGVLFHFHWRHKYYTINSRPDYMISIHRHRRTIESMDNSPTLTLMSEYQMKGNLAIYLEAVYWLRCEDKGSPFFRRLYWLITWKLRQNKLLIWSNIHRLGILKHLICCLNSSSSQYDDIKCFVYRVYALHYIYFSSSKQRWIRPYPISNVQAACVQRSRLWIMQFYWLCGFERRKTDVVNMSGG